MSDSELGISVRTEPGVLVLAFDRASKKNAITAAMYQQLADALQAAQTDDQIKAVVFHGHPQIFTAGNDLKDFLSSPPAGPQSPVFQFLAAISSAVKPIIAGVSGQAVGIGTTLLMHCDMVYAAENARFSMPFTKLGLCPEAASSYLFPAIAGYQRAAEFLLTGDSFDAHTAKEIGLVNAVLPVEALLPKVFEQAHRLAALPAESLRVTKRLLKAGHAEVVQQRMAQEGAEFSRLLRSEAARQAFTAFLAKS